MLCAMSPTSKKAMQPPAVFRWLRRHDALLGTMRDQEVADRLELSRSAVQVRRASLGIQSWRLTAVNRRKVDRLVGKFPDIEVARRCNVSAGVVNRRRNELSLERGEVIEAPRAAYRRHSLEDARIAAAEFGGACVSKTFSGQLEWRCAQGHVFKASAHKVIRRRQWCGACHGY